MLSGHSSNHNDDSVLHCCCKQQVQSCIADTCLLPTAANYSDYDGLQAAVIRWAGTDAQQQWVADIDTIADVLRDEELSPSIIVVGKVVQLSY